MKNFIALSGLPRTGSTLLTSILFQNPEIHTEGHSALVQLMWDMKMSCEGSASSWLISSYRQDVQHGLLSAMPEIFYGNTKAKNVFDKNTCWTIPENIQMIKDYIRPDPKVIVMLRSVEEIIESFIRVRKASGWQDNLDYGLTEENYEILGKPLSGIDYAMENNNGEFIFNEYDDLVDSTTDVLKSIYNFCEIDYFEHDLNNIENKNPENDAYLDMIGLHDIRKTISRRGEE